MSATFFSALAVGVAGASVDARAVEPRPVVERRLGVMGTTLVVEVEAVTRDQALAASEAAIRAIEDTEARLSTWRDDTELARLNRAPLHEPVALSPALAVELAGALACAEVTAGAFEPLLAALVSAWDLRGAGRRPSDREIAAARARSGSDALRLVPGAAVRTRPAQVEEGGFGKGAALDRAAAALAAAGGVTRALLDLGGQVLVIGAHRVPLAHPFRRGEPVLDVLLDHGSLATSGNAERRRIVEGVAVGHILDPRRGRPAPDFGVAAVWAPSALWADCLSTALYVLGPEAALAWAQAHSGIEVVLLERTAGGIRVRATAGLRGRLRSRTTALPIEWNDADHGGRR